MHNKRGELAMWRDAISKKNPMRIFEKGIHGGLGKGNLGAIMARAGVGKTACLIQISLDNLLRGQNVLHFSVGKRVDEVRDWYNEMLGDLTRACNLLPAESILGEIEPRRIIQSYADHMFSADRMEAGIARLKEHSGFAPDVVLVDGHFFESLSRSDIERIKDLARAHAMEVWFAVQTHREGAVVNDRGIPAPCHLVDDLLSVVVFLEPFGDSVRLRLMKDHDNPNAEDLHLLLDPNTLLIRDEISQERIA
ncbi:MAG: AAA family ATPase [bacterium]